MESIDIVNDIAESTDYEWVGIRTQEVPFDMGKMVHFSHIWDNGEDTGSELDGVCAIQFRPGWWSKIHAYVGTHHAIIAGNDGIWGEDPGEIVISDAKVIYIID